MGQLKLAEIFQSAMVLQRDKPIPVWGTAKDVNSGTVVTVALGCSSAEGMVKDGEFRVTLPPMEAARGLTMTVSTAQDESEKSQIVLGDINVGDVYLAGGQSNMEFALRYEAHFQQLRREPENPDIRMYHVPQIAYEGQKRNLPHYGYWFTKNDPAWPDFSAIGYVFACYIQEETGVPVGVIGCNWGGTSATAWMSADYAGREPVPVYLREYEQAVEGRTPEELKSASEVGWAYGDSYHCQLEGRALSYGLTPQEQEEWIREHEGAPEIPMGPYHAWRPFGLYTTMLKKVAPLPLRGVLWYQGESDCEHGEVYDKLFALMAECWREAWQDPQLPFFTVQIAPFGEWLGCTGELYPALRESQHRAARTIPGVYMTSIMDLGMYEDIHPKEKCEVARRLALLALQHLYGKPVSGETPEMTQVIRRGDQLVIHFCNVGEGLHLEGCQIHALRIGQGKADVSIRYAVLQKDKLILTCEALSREKLRIEYAWSAYCEVNLFNSEGLPVKPFRCELPVEA